MSKTYDKPEAKATRVLTIHGKPPRLLRSFNKKEVSALAALLGSEGKLVDGAREMFDSIFMEHFKAVDGDKEPAADVAAQQKVREDAVKELEGGSDSDMADGDIEFKDGK